MGKAKTPLAIARKMAAIGREAEKLSAELASTYPELGDAASSAATCLLTVADQAEKYTTGHKTRWEEGQ